MLKKAKARHARGERIIKLADNFCYVYDTEPVHDVSQAMADERVSAVAVVDSGLHVTGIVEKNSLFAILGKPFGRDLLSRKQIGEVQEPVKTFLFDAHILEVEEHIREDFSLDVIQYYVLHDTDNVFCGIFSSRDMLVYNALSQKNDLQMAAEIQERIVKPYFRVSGTHTEFVCSAVMTQSVGGDYYYVKRYGKEKWFFCLCDISGKGVAASIVTAVISGFMWNADFSRSVSDIVKSLNSLVLSTFCLEKYLTGIFGTYDGRTGIVDYCDMGHGLMYLIRRGVFGQIAPQADNCPLGIIEEPEIACKTIVMEDGDTLVLFTDGISEQANTAGELYDVKRIAPFITAAGGLKRAKIRFFEDFFNFKGTAAQHDDISLLLFSRTQVP